MPFQLVQHGILREFRLFVPIGWPYWVERVFTESSRNGLPLAIALHGGGQDPENFSNDWPLHTLTNPPDNANWEDRFFVLYPHGFASTTLAGEPLRGWNAGFTGDNLPVQNDARFIHDAIAAVETLLRAELDAVGLKQAPIDADRRYVFGYSQGRMMSYKLAHDQPNYFAALWVMSGAYGGRSHEGLTPTIIYDPQGSSTLSLFAHHGDKDTVVPPGPTTTRPGDNRALSRTLYTRPPGWPRPMRTIRSAPSVTSRRQSRHSGSTTTANRRRFLRPRRRLTSAGPTVRRSMCSGNPEIRPTPK
jgi:poly(3-hydroxybutyrate) depolymerase